MATPMTVAGLQKLKAELKKLKKFDRPQNIQDIAEAREHGDLKENAEYHAAKEKQGFIEGRIQEINGKMADAQVIDPSKLSGDKVLFGATVTLYDLDEDKEFKYCIVGEDEIEIKEGRISVYSPVARALIGKSVGDEVVIKTPVKKMNYEILSVNFI